MPRFIDGLEGLALALMAAAAEEVVVINETMGGATAILKHNIKAVHGDKTKLAALAQYTQDERTALGFSPDDPLLRDGKLLRDHIESEHLANVGRVGTSEPVQAYSEVGYVNARTGTSVPPRPAFRIGLQESREEIESAFVDALGFIFGASTFSALRIASRTEELLP